MPRIRRTAVLLSTAALVLLGSALPADARFADTSAAARATVSTMDVLPPGNVSALGTRCLAVGNGKSGTTTVAVTAAWTPSPSQDASGYRISALFTGGPNTDVAEVAAIDTTFVGSATADFAAKTVRIVVTTLTPYGWTESAQSEAIPC